MLPSHLPPARPRPSFLALRTVKKSSFLPRYVFALGIICSSRRFLSSHRRSRRLKASSGKVGSNADQSEDQLESTFVYAVFMPLETCSIGVGAHSARFPFPARLPVCPSSGAHNAVGRKDMIWQLTLHYFLLRLSRRIWQ